MHSKDVIRRLEAAGWMLQKVTVPHPKKDLPVGTLRSIFRQVGWQWDR